MAEPKFNKGGPKPSVQVTPPTERADASQLTPGSQIRGGTTTTPSPSEANSRQPVLTANESHKKSSYRPAASNRDPNSQASNLTEYRGSEALYRVTSLRPPDDPVEVEGGRKLSPAEAHQQILTLCARIWKDNMGRMYDKVVEADRRGHVDDKLYAELLDFFYCFLPMVMKAPLSDPIIVGAVALENHRKILNLFGDGRDLRGRAGRNDTHRWYSRPSDESFKSRVGEGLRGLQIALVGGKKGKGDNVVVK
ncbi:hypothetical protein N431DRAFT_337605 [Stipitochalara longipes BDJ]|nr:hypothetical protein N431DRAFT_337605 [Stipitochalara longipes BDJ]